MGLLSEPDWPDHGDRPLVFLLDASSLLERRILKEWIGRHQPKGLAPGMVDHAVLPPSRRRTPGLHRPDPRLQTALVEEDDYDPLMVPLRVVWLPPMRRGIREVHLADLLRFGDPRDPNWIRQRVILWRHPDRCHIILGGPATASDLRSRWEERTLPGDPADPGFSTFVGVQAGLALERKERALRGNRYKVPKFVIEDLLGRRRVQAGLARLTEETIWPPARIPRRAVHYLREIAATHSPYMIDLVAHLTRFIIERSYGGVVHYDHRQLAEVYGQAERNPLVFLPSHKSYIDTLLLNQILYENDYPPNHTAGGINMSFFPVGPLLRRTGVFFIRRTFRDNPVYKFVLQQYVHYLLEKRFPLEWYIEGGRSRSGKLREPRYGMLGYVVTAYDAGAADDVVIVPVAIAYDQLFDVADYAAEQSGGSKRKENFSRLVEFLRAMRRPHGAAHLRIGRPLSLAGELKHPEPHRSAHERHRLVQKLAFEVAVRINDVTPITPISLVTLALLGSGDKALSVGETRELLGPFLDDVRRRGLPTTEPLQLDSADQVADALEHLAEHGVVTRHPTPSGTLYQIGADQHLAAAYYRNTIIHFFVEQAIADVGLDAAAESGRPVEAFWTEVAALRDLLKFEFFFRRRKEFRRSVAAQMADRSPDWEQRLAAGEAARLLAESAHLTAPWVLLPFVEAYRVVADELADLAPGVTPEAKAVVASAIQRGRRYLLQHVLHTRESVSTELFDTALRLAANRGLLGEDVVDRRKGLAAEIRVIQHRIERIAGLEAARRARLE